MGIVDILLGNCVGGLVCDLIVWLEFYLRMCLIGY